MVAREEGTFANEIKLFGLYDKTNDGKLDLSLHELVSWNTTKTNVYIPHTAGRYQVKRFRKTQCPIVERLTNTLMRHGRNNGKKNLAIQIVKQALDIIHLTTNRNPVSLVLEAVSNAGPREDSARAGSGGVVKKTAVDVSPLRRINLALYMISIGAREAAFRSVRNVAECLADEIIACAAVNFIFILNFLFLKLYLLFLIFYFISFIFYFLFFIF